CVHAVYIYVCVTMKTCIIVNCGRNTHTRKFQPSSHAKAETSMLSLSVFSTTHLKIGDRRLEQLWWTSPPPDDSPCSHESHRTQPRPNPPPNNHDNPRVVAENNQNLRRKRRPNPTELVSELGAGMSLVAKGSHIHQTRLETPLELASAEWCDSLSQLGQV